MAIADVGSVVLFNVATLGCGLARTGRSGMVAQTAGPGIERFVKSF